MRCIADAAPDVRWTEMAGFPCAGTWIGPQEVSEHVFAGLGRDWQDYRFTLERLIDAGETVVGIGTYTGTFRATGKAMAARVAVTRVWSPSSSSPIPCSLNRRHAPMPGDEPGKADPLHPRESLGIE